MATCLNNGNIAPGCELNGSLAGVLLFDTEQTITLEDAKLLATWTAKRDAAYGSTRMFIPPSDAQDINYVEVQAANMITGNTGRQKQSSQRLDGYQFIYSNTCPEIDARLNSFNGKNMHAIFYYQEGDLFGGGLGTELKTVPVQVWMDGANLAANRGELKNTPFQINVLEAGVYITTHIAAEDMNFNPAQDLEGIVDVRITVTNTPSAATGNIEITVTTYCGSTPITGLTTFGDFVVETTAGVDVPTTALTDNGSGSYTLAVGAAALTNGTDYYVYREDVDTSTDGYETRSASGAIAYAEFTAAA